MDNEKILSSQETIRRFHERATALYEQPRTNGNVSQRHRHVDRDISQYPANEAAPTDAQFQSILAHLLSLAAQKPEILADMRRYVEQWACWLKIGLSTLAGFVSSVQTCLQSIILCWTCACGVLFPAPAPRSKPHFSSIIRSAVQSVAGDLGHAA